MSFIIIQCAAAQAISLKLVQLQPDISNDTTLLCQALKFVIIIMSVHSQFEKGYGNDCEMVDCKLA